LAVFVQNVGSELARDSEKIARERAFYNDHLATSCLRLKAELFEKAQLSRLHPKFRR
jgi:hypothetical protein